MRENIINFIATIVIAVVLSLFLPWWSVMVASFLTALFLSLKKYAVFFIPFLAIAVFWIAYAFWLGHANDFILSKKIAELLPLGGNPYLLLLVTGLIGGIAGGFAGIFGKQVASVLKPTKE